MENFWERYEWFLPARVLLAQKTGVPDRLLQIIATARPLPFFASVTPSTDGSGSSDELIDRFLTLSNLRIVAEEGEVTEEIRTEAELDAEDDPVTEELAEIYLEQGLIGEAIAIYRRLHLDNPEKSAYFAALIEKLKKNKLKL